VAIPKLLKAWELHSRAVLQSQRMLMARQMILVPLISRTKHDLASGYGDLDIGRVFQRMANQGGLHKKLQQLVFRQMGLPAWFEIEALHQQRR
jgi:hypothetical protein